MRTLIQFLVIGLFVIGSGVSAFAEAGTITAAQVPTDDVIANITLVGLAMIGVVLAKFGIKAAKSMIS